jgi:hypothetical protein
MTTHITDTERKLRLTINLLWATNEVLSDKARGLREEIGSLTAERDALATKIEKLELDNDPDALTIAYMAGMERGKDRPIKGATT